MPSISFCHNTQFITFHELPAHGLTYYFLTQNKMKFPRLRDDENVVILSG